MDVQKAITRETGGMSAGLQSSCIYGTESSRGFFHIDMRCLEGRTVSAEKLVYDIAENTIFTEVEHIRVILSERLLSLKNLFTSNGHMVAMRRASS